MTKEEMLEQLKHDRDLCNFNPSTGESEPISEDCRKSAEALDMAIKALEQPTSDDCVSRAEVLKGCILIPFYQVIDKLNKLAKIEQICKESFSNSQDSILAIARIREVLVQE